MINKSTTHMTDRLWSMHRLMAERIARAFFDYASAADADKDMLEKRLFDAVKKRGRYSHRPSA